MKINSMRVLLVNPPITFAQRKRMGPVVNNLFYNSPPLGLCYLAAVLEENNITVRILDAAVEGLETAGVMQHYSKFRPDIVGITSTTYSFQSAVSIAMTIKKENPSIRIIIGGSHVSADPESSFLYNCFDVGVIGEGEITLLELIKSWDGKKDLREVSGIVFRRDSELYLTKPRDYIENLDTLPFPSRHLIPMELYQPQPNDERARPKISMISSRGCPFDCIFCDKNVFGKKYRSFSPEYIVSEMEYLIDNFGAKDIAFLDSCFTVNKERVESIILEMNKRQLGMSWTCTARADVVTRELLDKMKKAGCWRIRLGIESGDEEVLGFIKKGITRKQVQDATGWAAEAGLQPKGFFMIGHLIDTKKSIEETIRFAKSLPLKDITVQINTPLKNTYQYGVYKKYGSLVVESSSRLSYFEPVFIPDGLTREYLKKIYREFYSSWYLRPVVFWRHLKSLHSLKDIRKYLKALSLLFFLFFDRRVENKNELFDKSPGRS